MPRRKESRTTEVAEAALPTFALAAKAYGVIEQKIVAREFPPGSLLSENQLAESLGMGRTPIREALQRLKHIGFVEIHPRRGVMVLGVDIVAQLELLEVRRELECFMVRCAAVRATPAEKANLAKLAKELRDAAKADDLERYFQINKLIHESEVAAAHNQMLRTTMDIIHAQSRRFWYAYVERTKSFTVGAERHGEVIAAICAGDQERAERAVGDLMAFLEMLTRTALTHVGDGGRRA